MVCKIRHTCSFTKSEYLSSARMETFGSATWFVFVCLQQESSRNYQELLQRLHPDVTVDVDPTSEQWPQAYEKLFHQCSTANKHVRTHAWLVLLNFTWNYFVFNCELVHLLKLFYVHDQCSMLCPIDCDVFVCACAVERLADVGSRRQRRATPGRGAAL